MGGHSITRVASPPTATPPDACPTLLHDRVRADGEYSVIRISFDRPVNSLEEAMAAMQRLARDPANLPTLAAAPEMP